MRKVKTAKQRRPPWRTMAAVLVGVGFLGGLSWFEGRTPVPPYRHAATAGPLPATLLASRFRGYPLAERAYQDAAELPGIVVQQPCYCHCERLGHKSLLDCYASDHAASCPTCIKEVLLVHQMATHASTAAQIRNAIIQGKWQDVDVSLAAR